MGPDCSCDCDPGWAGGCSPAMGGSEVGSSGWGLNGMGGAAESPACHAMNQPQRKDGHVPLETQKVKKQG